MAYRSAKKVHLKFIMFMIGGNITYPGSFNTFRKVTWYMQGHAVAQLVETLR